MANQSPEQIRTYFKEQVQPVFESLIAKIVINRPEDIEEYVIRYFQNCSKSGNENSDSEEDPDRFEEVSQEEFDLRKALKRQNMVRKMRKGVSSEANQMFTAQRKPISLRSVGHKDEKTQIMTRFYFMHSFLFQDFEEEDKQFLINSMVVIKTKAEQAIIREGDFGDCMYFVQSGLFECSISEKDPKSNRKDVRVLRNYQMGDSFGQICLLHSAKRQATVVSKTEGQLYVINREVYTHVKKMSMVKKRELYIQNLRKVNIFASLNRQDFQKLCDLLHEVRFQPNEYVIHEGDMGTKFYIVIEGLLASKSSQEEAYYQYYKEGDYFGEYALITKKPRQVSILAVTQCRLVSLSSRVFLNVINHDKANLQIQNKYKGAKPMTGARRKKHHTSEIDQT